MVVWIGVVAVEMERDIDLRVEVMCPSDVLEVGGEEEEGISIDSWDLILYNPIYGFGSTVLGRLRKRFGICVG